MSEIFEQAEETPTSIKPLPLFFVICAGILLPLATLITELATQMCAEAFFDPVPSLWHVLIVAVVPLANAHILWSLYSNNLERITFLSWVSAISGGAAIFYSLLFLPLSPIALIGILFAGLGFLPLAPFFGLWSVLLLRRHLKQAGRQPFSLKWGGLLAGFLIVVSIIGLSEMRFIITRYGLEKATAGSVEEQEQGIEFLRTYGNEEYILQLTKYRHRVYISDFFYDLLRGSSSGSQRSAEEVYYRLTGKLTSEMAVRSKFSFANGEQTFWRGQDISLASSQMDGSIDNDASLGYLEWTFTLKNKNEYSPLEGFTQIQLPPNAVVSRLTLWIDGEEREAAFAGRSQVTNAYQQVTARKRDPVLVTTAGRDRVNLKCFPIPAKGGEMKMRIGITFPLILEDEKNGLVRLPYFRDRNFQIPDSVKHSVWIESKRELEASNANLRKETKENLFAVRGSLPDKEITDSFSTIRAVKSDEYKRVWAGDDGQFIAQEVTEAYGAKPAKFVFVVDTSQPMAAQREDVAAAIENLSPETETALILANGNALNKDAAYPNSISGKPAEIGAKIREAEFGGGTDNLPALTKGWDVANETPNSAVIWIHAPQPYKFSTSTELAQRLLRRPNETAIYSLSTANGLDEVEKELNNLSYLQSVPRFGSAQQDLGRLISQLNQSKKSFSYRRVKLDKFDTSLSKETSKHLVRLWANDEVNRLITAGGNEPKAIELASKNQLVTPVTGAVVLETQQQYDQFGLQPVNKNSVPTIPEPEFYLLLTVVLGVLVWLFVIRKLF